MDTIYYHLNTKKVKASGGAELITFEPAGIPVSEDAPRGEVLDFARCRQRLATKAAWRDLTDAAADLELPGAEEEPEAVAYAPRPRRSHGLDWLELAASGAILVTALAAAGAFLATI